MYNRINRIDLLIDVKVILLGIVIFISQNVYSQNSENVTQIGLWENEGCTTVAVNGTYAYVAAYTDSMLYIIDISNPTIPTALSTFKSKGNIFDVVASSSYAYVLDEEGLYIVDVSTPSSPKEVGFLEMASTEGNMAIKESYVYVAAGSNGMHIINISNPEVPLIVYTFNTEANATSVKIKGSYAYLTDGHYGWGVGGKGLCIIDITDPSHPVEVSFIGSSIEIGGAINVAVSDSSAYVIYTTDASTVMQTIDITNLLSPEEVGEIPFNLAWNTVISGYYFYLAQDYWGLHIMDISNPWVLKEVGSFITGDMAMDVVVNGSYIYLVDNNNGLYILQNDLLVGIEVESNPILQKFNLEQNYPNPFNPSTQISYQIPKDGFVNLVVYNSLGQVVAELVNEHQTSGEYSVQFNATGLSSGMYIYRMMSGNFEVSKKLLLLK